MTYLEPEKYYRVLADDTGDVPAADKLATLRDLMPWWEVAMSPTGQNLESLENVAVIPMMQQLSRYLLALEKSTANLLQYLDSCLRKFYLRAKADSEAIGRQDLFVFFDFKKAFDLVLRNML